MPVSGVQIPRIAPETVSLLCRLPLEIPVCSHNEDSHHTDKAPRKHQSAQHTLACHISHCMSNPETNKDQCQRIKSILIKMKQVGSMQVQPGVKEILNSGV